MAGGICSPATWLQGHHSKASAQKRSHVVLFLLWLVNDDVGQHREGTLGRPAPPVNTEHKFAQLMSAISSSQSRMDEKLAQFAASLQTCRDNDVIPHGLCISGHPNVDAPRSSNVTQVIDRILHQAQAEILEAFLVHYWSVLTAHQDLEAPPHESRAGRVLAKLV